MQSLNTMVANNAAETQRLIALAEQRKRTGSGDCRRPLEPLEQSRETGTLAKAA